MSYKSNSATFAALAATVTLIVGAPIAQAATLTQGFDPTAVSILLPTALNTTSWIGTISAGPFIGDQIAFSSSLPVNISGGAVSSNTSPATNPTITIDTSSSGLLGKTFTDLTFQTQFTGNPNGSLFTVEGGDGSTASRTIGNGLGTTTQSTFTSDIPLTSAVLMPSRAVPISSFGLSGLTEIPLPATFPLFASGLGALGLMGWRRKRKSTTSILAA